MPAARLYPFTFEPRLKERVWGGRRLGELYHKALPPAVPVGESWEIVDRPGDASVIANGVFAGKDLHWLCETHGPGLFGQTTPHPGRFPLLIKILDANEKLSLQVHPPADKASKLGGEPKTEFWYIAEAAAGAELYVGLKKGCTRQQFARELERGSVSECFHRVPVRAGDAMFLPSGRVHAIGAGLVIFEIQQNSDTTYRVFDWNRAGLDGKPRQLHVKESLESINFDDYEPELVRPQTDGSNGVPVPLVKHELFGIDLVTFAGGKPFPLGSYTMQIIGVINDAVQVKSSGEELLLSAGQFCLVPASLDRVTLLPQKSARFLCVRSGPST